MPKALEVTRKQGGVCLPMARSNNPLDHNLSGGPTPHFACRRRVRDGSFE
jgi:hypothetical protein